MSALSMMVHRCTIKRNYPENVDGIVKSSFATVMSGTRCLIQEKSGNVAVGAAGAILKYDAVCFLPPGTDIQPLGNEDDKDQLIQTTPATNVAYLVNHVAERSGMGNHLTAYLTRHKVPPVEV